jgi:plasmid stability protein
MRITTRIDDDLLNVLKKRAAARKVSFAQEFNAVLRLGLTAQRVYREKTFAMGIPKVDLTKALSLAAALEDEETLLKMTVRPRASQDLPNVRPSPSGRREKNGPRRSNRRG